MNKIKKIIYICVSFLILIFTIYFTPKFLNFMEKQQDILRIKRTSNCIGKIYKDIPKYKENNFNFELPDDVKKEMKERELKIKKEEELKRKRQEQIRKENKQKEIKISKNNLNTSSRGNTQIRSDNGYIAFVATGYCPCSKCCGKTNGITASGAKAQAGVTVAMSPRFKFGTQIEIKGMGRYIVQDRGGAINGNKIDIFFNTHKEALRFGRRTVYLKVI